MKYLKRFDKLNETSIVRNNQGKWWEEKFDTEDDVDFIITKIKEKYPKEEVNDKVGFISVPVSQEDLIDMICWFEDEFKKDIVDEDEIEIIHQLGIEYGLINI